MGDFDDSDVVFTSESTPTASSKFEVTVNGATVHSKIGGDGFPDIKKVQTIVDQVTKVLS